MKTTLSLVVAAMLVLTVAVVFAGDSSQCSSKASSSAKASCSKTSTAALASADASCEKAAAAVTANAADCCKATLAKYMEACCASASAANASTSACTKGASAQTASSSSCTKSASTQTASSCSSKKADAATANAADCCKKTITAFLAAVSEYQVASSGSSGACLESASTARVACTKSAGTKTAKSSCSSKSVDTASYASVVDTDIPYHDNDRVVLTGKAVCGMCDLKVTDSCETFLKTKEGKVYPLLQNDYVKKMKDETKKGKELEVVTRVRKLDGVKYLEVRNLKVI